MRQTGKAFAENSIDLKIEEFEFGSSSCVRLLSERAAGRRVLVFIHGYNNTFSSALTRARAFAEDIHFNGVVLVWSWPSAGFVAAYDDDSKAAAWSADHFIEFISSLMSTDRPLSIDFFAHSMGNKLLLDLATRLKNDRLPGGRAIIFAAPDIATDEFTQRVFPDRFQTLYASEDDRLLQVAAYLRSKGTWRAGGYVGGGGVLIVPGVESVDAILRGHSYVFEDPRALRDIGRLLNHQEKASIRGLTERQRGTNVYWVINP